MSLCNVLIGVLGRENADEAVGDFDLLRPLALYLNALVNDDGFFKPEELFDYNEMEDDEP